MGLRLLLRLFSRFGLFDGFGFFSGRLLEGCLPRILFRRCSGAWSRGRFCGLFRRCLLRRFLRGLLFFRSLLLRFFVKLWEVVIRFFWKRRRFLRRDDVDGDRFRCCRVERTHARKHKTGCQGRNMCGDRYGGAGTHTTVVQSSMGVRSPGRNIAIGTGIGMTILIGATVMRTRRPR